jgi:predicted glycosyltransferase
MKISFHLGHPAHYHLFKNVIKSLQVNEHQISILIKKKYVLEDLLKESGFTYRNMLPASRKNSKADIRICQNTKPNE